MIKKIAIEQLVPGMFIHDLNCGWLDHPFLKNTFYVKDEAIIAKVIEAGVKEVYIDTVKGADVYGGRSQSQQEVNEDLDRQIMEIAARKAEKPIATNLAEEGARARRLHTEANRVVRNVMTEVKMGVQIEVERLEPMIESMVESIFRNQDALLPLARLKSHDNYTFEHSVGVCTFMVAFARSMKMSKEVIRDIAMGALLHDVGKARVPDKILNKPGKLTDEEFVKMKSHVVQSILVLKQTPKIAPIALQVAAEHHERFDGTGYPNRLKGQEISLYGQMATIVDVYDAISSDRVYHKGMPPPQALKKLLEWSQHHFDPNLVQSFIRSVGIYPTGTLVRLDSGRLGVVTEQNEGNLLQPVVRVFYHAGKQYYIKPELVDLTKSQDRVAGVENYEKWKINPYQWLPS